MTKLAALEALGFTKDEILKAALGASPNVPPAHDLAPFIGKPCLARTRMDGVKAGIVREVTIQPGNAVVTFEPGAAQLWRWKAAQGFTLLAVAEHGISRRESRIEHAGTETILFEVCSLTLCTDKAWSTMQR